MGNSVAEAFESLLKLSYSYVKGSVQHQLEVAFVKDRKLELEHVLRTNQPQHLVWLVTLLHVVLCSTTNCYKFISNIFLNALIGEIEISMKLKKDIADDIAIRHTASIRYANDFI